ncbi:hypothetical protein [Nocardioides pyridinolyticus]
MTPRRHRTFLDHKPPLVAFVLVAVASMGLMVHVARSDAAPAWLRDGATVVISGGSPLTRQLLEPAAPAEREPAPAVAHGPAPAARPPHDGLATPDLHAAPAVPSAELDAVPAYPGTGPGGPAHLPPGLTDGHGQGNDGHAEPAPPVRGHQSGHGHGHSSSGHGRDDRDDRGPRGHGHGQANGHGHDHGHGHGDDDRHPGSHGHGHH